MKRRTNKWQEAFSAMVFTALALLSHSALGQSQHLALQETVKNFLEELHTDPISNAQRVEVSVGYIDPRLNLPTCNQPLNLSLNGSQRPIGKLQVKVQCLGAAPWTKYVPAEVAVFRSILVAGENIRRGTILEEHHFSIQETNIANLRRTPATEPEQVIGMELKYALTMGGAFSLEGLQKPKVIRRGDLVQLVAETETLRIRQSGEALQDGEVGKLINVRNSSSEMVVQAVVVAAGRVKVQL